MAKTQTTESDANRIRKLELSILFMERDEEDIGKLLNTIPQLSNNPDDGSLLEELMMKHALRYTVLARMRRNMEKLMIFVGDAEMQKEWNKKEEE
jgi:hypothetical protein